MRDTFSRAVQIGRTAAGAAVCLVAVTVAIGAAKSGGPAAPAITSGTFECGTSADSLVLALFVEDDGASECREFGTGGPVECRNAAGDVATGDCRRGCSAFTGAAGCLHARRNDPGSWLERLPVEPTLTVECQGRSYELTPAKSGGSESECQREEDATGRTTGGECTSRDSDGNEQTDAKADCEHGCEYERRGATCKMR